MSKFFKNHKKDFIMWGLVLLIFGLIFLIVFYENKDKNHYTNVACNSDINIVDDEINFEKNYYIDENGNVVSSNLFNVNSVSNGGFDGAYPVIEYSIVNNGISISNSGDLPYNRVSCLVPLNSGTYTLSFGFSGSLGRIVACYVSNNVEEIIFDLNNISSNISYSFTLSSSLNVYFYFYSISRYSSSSFNNIMLNSGSSASAFEPFGTWFKNYGQNYSVLYNIFNNSIGKLYRNDNDVLVFSENIFLSASDVSISMDNFPNIFNYLNSYNSEDTSTYPTPYFYFTIELNTSTNSPLVFSLNNAILDTEISLLYNSQNLSVFTRGTDSYHIFVNQDSIYTYNEIYYSVFYAPDYVSLDFNISTSGILYNKGYDDGVNSIKYDYHDLQTQYSTLQTQYSTLDSNYRSLLEQYNALNSGEYSLSELIWSIGSVPFAVLTSGFNVNVMGISLASIITGLFTSMLLIWIIKKFFR